MHSRNLKDSLPLAVGINLSLFSITYHFWGAKYNIQALMEGNIGTLPDKEEEEVVEEEYVLFDLDDVMGQVHIPADAPYVLSVGEYEETVGTCLVFSETNAKPVLHEETGPSEVNLFSGASIVDTKPAPDKQVRPITSLNKILKFRLMEDSDVESTVKQTVLLVISNS